MICAACGTTNAPGRKFCGECGSVLAQPCPQCGAGNEPGTKFCGECGSPLVAVAVAPAAQPTVPVVVVEPVAERRLVSVLFADLVGFTSISEGRDSEDVRELQSRYFDTCRRLIELYGGTVEKFIGDAVMAVWGTPTATEDDAERAVRAALDLVAAVTALGDEVGIGELRARAGVLTGEATVNIGADGEGMVSGDIVNTASRVQSLAGPGQVLVGDPTRRSTEPTIAYEDAGAHELKGKEGLHKLWRAIRVVSGARGALKSEGLEAPFVGRDRELRQIKDLFHACAEERRAHLVSVTGIAGIGKSRLAWEFYKYFDGLAQIIYWHRGRCLSYGEGVTYWALADMVRMRCRISEDEGPASAADKLREVLDEHVTDPGERAFVEPRMGHLLGIEEGSAFTREDLFAAWRVFFERLADVFPTVLAFEDMQWADASLLDFIEYLLEWSRQSPILVVTAARPELVDKRPTWGAGKRNFTSIYLEPLSETAMRELLEGLVPGLPTRLRDQILARAEGVPLYAMETVRMLLDQGHLVREGSTYQPAGEVESLEVPETLHALIAARLDGLTQQERQVVQDGAVLGKTFTRDALADLSGIPDAALDSVLVGLVRKEVLSIQSDPRSPEHGQYGFLQDLTRRVAYETLARRERRNRHLAAAAYMERAFPDDDEVVEVLASHYLDAHTAAPDMDAGGEVMRRAHELLVRAAERARSLGASTEARRYYSQAAELTGDLLEQAGLLDKAAEMALLTADHEEVVALAQRAMDLYDGAGDPRRAAMVSMKLSRVERLNGRTPEAIERLEHAYQIMSTQPDGDHAMLTAWLAASLFFAGQKERSAALADEALEIAEALALPAVLIRGWMTKGMVASSSRPEEARGLFQLALEMADRYGVREDASQANGNLSDLNFRRDRYADALVLLERSAADARMIGSRAHEWFALSESTYALYMLGRWDEAMAAFGELPRELLASAGTLQSPLSSILEIELWRGNLDEGRELLASYDRMEDSDDIQERAAYAGAKACVRYFEGRYAEAVESGERALEAADSMGPDGQDIKMGLTWALEAAVASGDRIAVDRLAGWVEALPPGLRAPALVGHAHRARARMAASLDEARSDHQAAVAVFRRLGLPFWLAVSLCEFAEALVRDGRGVEAEPMLAEARAVFETLGVPGWLERVVRAEQGEPAGAVG